MALTRRSRKLRIGRSLAVLLPLLAAAPAALPAATTERIVSDWHTGLAIGGFDPVAYFTDGEPVPGRPEFELAYGGVIWRFRNDGNRAAFSANPEVYAPQYGGYDPIGVTRGVARPGNPLLWNIVSDRLYLSYDAEAQAKFTAETDTTIAGADARWPDVLRTLTP